MRSSMSTDPPNCAKRMSDQTALLYLQLYPGPGVTQYPSGRMVSMMMEIGPSR